MAISNTQAQRLISLFVMLMMSLNLSTAQDGFSVVSTTNPLTNQCLCTVEAPETIQCTKVVNSATLDRITTLQSQVTTLSATVDEHVALFQSQTVAIDSLTARMTTTIETLERIESGTLIVSRPELVQIRNEINDMEQLLLTLQRNHTAAVVVNALRAEIDNVTTLLNELEMAENADTSDLLDQIKALRAKVEECQNQEVPSSLYDLWEEGGTQDSCADLIGVSLPYTVTGLRSVHGAWFRDPIVFQRRVYSFEMPNGRNAQQVKHYKSLKDYHDNTGATTITLPESSQGAGLIAFNGSIYYNLYGSGNIGKYDVVSGERPVTKRLDSAGYNNARPYRSQAYSDIDLLADELGLWVVYSTTAANGFLVISKLDPETLDILDTWQTNYPKGAAGNCFITCGVVYCTNGFNSHINKINYKFDTKTEKEEFLNIPFDNKFLKTYALNYNARDQKLYGWDNGHQMIYDLIFSGDKEEITY